MHKLLKKIEAFNLKLYNLVFSFKLKLKNLLFSRSSDKPHHLFRVQHRTPAERRPTRPVAASLAPAAVLRVETPDVQKRADLATEKKRGSHHIPATCHRKQQLRLYGHSGH